MIRRKWLLWTLTGSAVLSLILLGGLWLLLHHIPAWYQPAYVTDARLGDVRASAADAFNLISERIAQGQSFEVALDERQVTEWISARERVWPASGGWLPAWLEDPVISFRHDRIILAARLNLEDRAWLGGEWIGGVHLSVDLIEENMLVLRLRRITGGSLPVPSQWLAAPISSLLRMEDRDVGLLPSAAADLLRRMRDAEPLQLLSQGVRRANRFIWENGRRPFRIAGLRAADGKLTLTIDPL